MIDCFQMYITFKRQPVSANGDHLLWHVARIELKVFTTKVDLSWDPHCHAGIHEEIRIKVDHGSIPLAHLAKIEHASALVRGHLTVREFRLASDVRGLSEHFQDPIQPICHVVYQMPFPDWCRTANDNEA